MTLNLTLAVAVLCSVLCALSFVAGYYIGRADGVALERLRRR